MGQLVRVIFVLQDGLSSQRYPCIEQLIGNHGSDCGFAWVWHNSNLGLGSLTDPNCLSHLGHHGQDTCRQLLVAEVRQTEVLLFGTFQKNPDVYITRRCVSVLSAPINYVLPIVTSSAEPGSKKVTFRPSPGFFTGACFKIQREMFS